MFRISNTFSDFQAFSWKRQLFWPGLTQRFLEKLFAPFYILGKSSIRIIRSLSSPSASTNTNRMCGTKKTRRLSPCVHLKMLRANLRHSDAVKEDRLRSPNHPKKWRNAPMDGVNGPYVQYNWDKASIHSSPVEIPILAGALKRIIQSVVFFHQGPWWKCTRLNGFNTRNRVPHKARHLTIIRSECLSSNTSNRKTKQMAW